MTTSIGDVSIGGGVNSGLLQSFGSIGAIKVGGKLVGESANSGRIFAGGNIKSVPVGESLTGGNGSYSVGIYSANGSIGNARSARMSSAEAPTVSVPCNNAAKNHWTDGTNQLLDANSLVASISKIVIKGAASASVQNGISAELVKSLSLGGIAVNVSQLANHHLIAPGLWFEKV